MIRSSVTRLQLKMVENLRKHNLNRFYRFRSELSNRATGVIVIVADGSPLDQEAFSAPFLFSYPVFEPKKPLG